MSDVFDLIHKVGEKEASITDQEFISPIFFNDFVATKIYGIIYTFKISEKKPGWYNVKPIDFKNAQTVNAAGLPDIHAYLNKLKKIRLILVLRKKDVYLAIPEKSNNLRLSYEQLIPLYLFDDIVLDFDKVIARFDGANFWFHELDPTHDPSKSAYLREQVLKCTNVKNIKYSGLTIEDKIAYALSSTLSRKLVADQKKMSLQQDVEHAGGEFVKFIEKKDHYQVTFNVDGQTYSSNVSKTDKHSVITAGICLSGEDRKYDLKSLVTIMREGQQKGKIYRTNNVH